MIIEWYKPGQIFFDPEQIKWIFEHWECIGAGHWPTDPNADLNLPNVREGAPRVAPFLMASDIAAELTWRLGRCGKDGKLALQCLGFGWNEDIIADILGWNPNYLRRRMRRALAYCMGAKRKDYSYKDFIGHRRK